MPAREVITSTCEASGHEPVEDHTNVGCWACSVERDAGARRTGGSRRQRPWVATGEVVVVGSVTATVVVVVGSSVVVVLVGASVVGDVVVGGFVGRTVGATVAGAGVDVGVVSVGAS